MKWKKLGLLYEPKKFGRHPKLLTHAANPLAIQINDSLYRVFYSGRDNKNRSSVGAVDINFDNLKIVTDHYNPFFIHGTPDSFYADGVSIGCHYSINTCSYILFMGWQSPADKHWRGDIGRLTVCEDLTLKLESNNPFISTSNNEIDPISLSYPWVIKNLDNMYEMWYGSTKTWDFGNGEMLHVINSAHSSDGHIWHRDGLSIPYIIGTAQAFSRPTVYRNSSGQLEMWFSYRGGQGDKYKIGYALRNGDTWKLALEETGLDVSSEGWDSEMIEYPFVFNHKGKLFMLYNGNNYGKSGFGIAILEQN